jgi:hypothetical protein
MDAEQRFNRNFFLDKSLWTTIFPDKMPLQGFIRNFFRHNNHCQCLVGGLSGISGQTSTGCLEYTLVFRQSIVCGFSSALMAPNAQTHLPQEAGARHERTLEAVRCRRLLGAAELFPVIKSSWRLLSQPVVPDTLSGKCPN